MQKDPEWKTTEQLVAFIEQVISPNAKVSHNERLQVLGSTRKRQCDAVIRLGEPPRQQVIIVEVQKRKRKPSLTTFHGWVAKMHEVGANGLICVSQLGFPKSVVEVVASKIGPVVKLVSLSGLRDPLLWADFTLGNKFSSSFTKWKIAKVHPPILRMKIEPFRASFPYDLPVLSGTFEGPAEKSVIAVGHEFFASHNPLCCGPDVEVKKAELIRFTLEGPAWLHLDGTAYPLKEWTFEYEVEHETEIFEVEYSRLKYTQEDIDGVQAWVATTEFERHGRQCKVTFVFKPIDGGYLAAAAGYLHEI